MPIDPLTAAVDDQGNGIGLVIDPEQMCRVAGGEDLDARKLCWPLPDDGLGGRVAAVYGSFTIPNSIPNRPVVAMTSNGPPLN
jgi:hypothetical protein